MFKRLSLLLLVLLLCCPAALATASLPADLTVIEAEAFQGDESLLGVVDLPAGVRTVGERAFADTGVYALYVPEGCMALGADVLSGTNAAYLYLSGAETAVTADTLGDVPYVFAPAGSPAAALGSRYADVASLLVHEGFYYRVTAEGASPLCPVDGTILDAAVTLPKAVEGHALCTLAELVMPGCEHVRLTVPGHLPIPDGLNAEHLCEIAVSEPVTEDEIAVGTPATFTVEAEGCVTLTYSWTITNGAAIHEAVTDVPSLAYTPENEADVIVTVTVTDVDGHTAIASATFAIAAQSSPVVYRALLVGNTYPGTADELPGCDTDASAMKTMLSRMTASHYTSTVALNQRAADIVSAIRTAFADADENDVSLFYFSGHGTNTGALVGTSNSYLYPVNLRNVLDEIPGTKIVLLDCCYSGAFISKDGPADPSAFNSAIISAFAAVTKGDDDLAADQYQVITACTSQQTSKSLSGDDVYYWGAFTYGLCYGSGYDVWMQQTLDTFQSDTNADGGITQAEAVAGVKERIAYLSSMIDLPQAVQSHGDSSFVLWAY